MLKFDDKNSRNPDISLPNYYPNCYPKFYGIAKKKKKQKILIFKTIMNSVEDSLNFRRKKYLYFPICCVT